MLLTFDGGGREVSEEADGHFQNVSFLQFGVARVVFANQRQNETLQVTETVIDTSSSSFLQQRLQSLKEKGRESVNQLNFSNKIRKHFGRNPAASSFFSPVLTFLSSLACFLWATVDLTGWAASAVMLGLILLVAVLLRGGTCFRSG